MRRIADVGAAVIGTGFIGTVHVEALRRIGVQVRGVLGSTPGAWRRPCRRASASRAPTTRWRPPARPARRRRPRHVAQRPPPAADARRSSPRAAMSCARSRWRCRPPNRASWSRRPRRPASSTPPTSTSATTRSTSTPTTSSSGGGIGDVRLVTGRYFQDWLLLESDWNWRLEPDRGGALRAVGDIGSHWLDLMAFVTGQRIISVMADLATFIEARREPTGPVETYSTDVADRDRHPRHRDRGRRDDPAPLRERRPRGGQHQPDQRRAQELAPVRDRRVDRVGRLGFGAARPDVDRPPRAAERDPHPEPGAHGAGRTCRRGAPGRSRRGLRRHLRRPLPGRLRRRRRGRPVRPAGLSDLRRRPRRDARQRRDRRERATRVAGWTSSATRSRSARRQREAHL